MGEPPALHFDFVVVGGGIAAVSCVQQLASVPSTSTIAIVSAGPLVKAVTNAVKTGYALEMFDVVEKSAAEVFDEFKSVRVIHGVVTKLHSVPHTIETSDGRIISYRRLCIATGGTPKMLAVGNPLVVGIRDTETVREFQRKLSHASRCIVVGNGGIATELVYELEDVEVIWAVKHETISASFVDAGAGTFFLSNLTEGKKSEGVSKRVKYTTDEGGSVRGSALGPDWVTGIEVKGNLPERGETRKVRVELQCEVVELLAPSEAGAEVQNTPEGFSAKSSWPIYVRLTNGHLYGVDLVVSATGVEPSTDVWLGGGNNFKVAQDGGLEVDNQMCTGVTDVYAAGDVCSAAWSWHPHWFQMRLWTQARQMGTYAGLCMAAHARDSLADFPICFEVFTHVTKFFGYKVVLLGRYNEPDTSNEALVRVTKGEEYVKVLVGADGRVRGAVLVGETDLEETLENLILNGTDVGHLKERLLDPNIDIEDYFD